MIELNVEQRQKLWPMIEGWQETMLWTCLQGHWGRVWADDAEAPKSARFIVGDFALYCGEPNRELAESTVEFPKEVMLMAQNEAWLVLLREIWEQHGITMERFAMKKEPNVFDRAHLKKLASQLPEGYSLKMLDKPLVEEALSMPWSWHLCGQYHGVEDFLNRGIGVAAVYDGTLAAAASSYSVYDTGIEIEIDTCPDHRGKGLATACGAGLILACLDRGLYPSWDAADIRSVHLAEKLGYHLDGPYTALGIGFENFVVIK